MEVGTEGDVVVKRHEWLLGFGDGGDRHDGGHDGGDEEQRDGELLFWWMFSARTLLLCRAALDIFGDLVHN